ncbi:MAG: type II toxin-antitoxin system VapC family toxin [Spirochaetia bacterium]|nr:type II toxin-antitoxin system VapC family toxin [Spirochaetia bacterium]
MIVLDTHTWIWLLNGDEKIKKSGYLDIIKKNIKDHTIFIPAISLWEVSMLVAKERIILSENTLDWVKKASSAPGMSVYPLSPEVAYESTILPGDFHGDPADRMIIATARVLNATLLTFDKEIIKYASKGFVNIIKSIK